MDNPYLPPTANIGNQAASSQVQGPAIALLIVSMIAIVVGVFGLLADVAFIASGWIEQLEEMNQGPISEHTQITIRIIWGILLVIASSFVFYGALQMKNLRRYGLAKAASTVALIPLVGPCCILGIPFGIWAFITLNKEEVRRSFS